jgi:uncharacterized iron-regulated membrane protein
MITALVVTSYIIAGVTLVGQLRRPASQWTAADRNRSWWIGVTSVLGLLGCGIFVGLAYLVGVVPAFAQSAVDDALRKQS